MYVIEKGLLQGKTDKKRVRFLPSPNFSERNSPEIDLLIIHNISLPPNQFGQGYVEKFFLNQLPVGDHPYFEEIKDLQVSSHLYIERDGKVTQFVPFDKKAWHAGLSCFAGRENCNEYSIGFDLEGCYT